MLFPSGVEDGACVGQQQNLDGIVAAVVTVTFNRPEYLARHLESLLSVHGRHVDNRCEQRQHVLKPFCMATVCNSCWCYHIWLLQPSPSQLLVASVLQLIRCEVAHGVLYSTPWE